MTSSLDEARAAYPHLGFALYALEPGGAVTLEIHAPDGQMFTARAKTEAAALAKMFPPEMADEPDEPEVSASPKETTDIFG